MTARFLRDNFSSNAHFSHLDAAADLAEVDEAATELVVDCDTNNIRAIGSFARLERLQLTSMKVNILAEVAGLDSLRMLSIEFCNSGYEDLSPLSGLDNLQCLLLHELRNPTSIEFLSGLGGLEALEIRSVRKVNDLGPIECLGESLTELKIETGGMLSGQKKMKTLKPLASLRCLEYLWLYVLSDDNSLEPLSHLQRLKKLCMNGLFRWEQYARLHARLPETECHWFKDKVIDWGIECPKCGTPSKVGLPGKGKRMVCSHCHPEKVEKLIAEYDAQYESSRAGNWS